MLLGVIATSIMITGCGTKTSSSSSYTGDVYLGYTDSSASSSSSSNSSSSSTNTERNLFTNDIDTRLFRSSSEAAFRDYDGSIKNFNYLVDRSIDVIASEILDRLIAVYGNIDDVVNRAAVYDGVTYHTYSKGTAISEKYAVHADGNDRYVFLYDENGDLIESRYGGKYNADAKKNCEVVYYNISSNNNNLLENLLNPSTLMLEAYLANDNTPSDTYISEDYYSGQMSKLAGSIYGKDYYILQDREIVKVDSSDYAWAWANYIKDNTAKDRLKYAIALMINGSSVADVASKIDNYSNYTDEISKIVYLDNYLTRIKVQLSEFIRDYVIGSDLVSRDDNSCQIVPEYGKNTADFERHKAYVYNDRICNSVLLSSSDSTNIGKYETYAYYLRDLYDESVFNTTNTYICDNTGTRTLSDEFDYIVGRSGSSPLGGSLKDKANVLSENYFYFYYGYYTNDGETIDKADYNRSNLPTPGYIDYQMDIKAVGNLNYPYNPSDMIAVRNVKNYSVIVREILSSIESATFDSSCSGVLGTTYAGQSIFPKIYRASADNSNIITELATAKSYDRVAVKSNGQISNLANYNLALNITSVEDITLVVTMEYYGSNAYSNKVELFNGVVSGTKSLSTTLGGLTLTNNKQKALEPSVFGGSMKLVDENGILVDEDLNISNAFVLRFRVIEGGCRVAKPFSLSVKLTNTKA